MNYSKIIKNDIANGEGIRTTLFVQGCNIHCDGCFNSDIWDFNGGKLYTSKTEKTILNISNHEYVSGLSILGGEPLDEKNISTVLTLIENFKNIFPDKTVWVWTGYDYETINYHFLTGMHDYDLWLKQCNKLLNHIDVLIDGKFISDKRDISLRFKGSSNQRVIDVQETLKQKDNNIIEYMECWCE